MTTNKPEVLAWRWRKPIVNDQGEIVGASAWEYTATPGFLPWWANDPLIRLSDYEALQAECEELKAQLSATQPAAQGMDAEDTILLNWLDAQVKNHAVHDGFLWQEGGWETDRGLVCAIQGKKQKKTVRQAIGDAIAAQAKKEGEKK